MNICLRSYVHLMCFNNTIYLYLRVGRIISGNIGKLRFIESLGAVPEFTCNGGLLYVGSSVAELARFVFAPKLAPLFNKLCVSLLVSSAFCHIPERTLELFSSFMAFNSFSSLMTMDCQVDEDVHFLHPLLSAINEGFKANKAA
ncbi:hypothetical protein T4B_2769, partial [Trichinella pseudospiralis]